MTRIFCLLVCCCSALLAGCSRESVEKYVGVDYQTTNRFAKNLAPIPGQFEKDIDALNQLISQFTGKIEVRWGEDQVFVSGKRDYVKYTDNYKSRARIDFERGVIQVETVATDAPKDHLKQAIITTLLTPRDPASVDLYSAAKVPLTGRPFLEGQVVDHEGKAITWQWRANRFADYLIDQRLKKKTSPLPKHVFCHHPDGERSCRATKLSIRRYCPPCL